MKLLKNYRWKSHPWSKTGFVYQTDLNFILSISNRNSTNETDLLNGQVVSEEKVWQNIKEEGMQEPLLIIIGIKDKTIRLESGNHRVKTAIKDNYTHLPVAFLALNKSYLNEVNGMHYYDAKNIVDFDKLISCPYPYQVDPKKLIDNKYFI